MGQPTREGRERGQVHEYAALHRFAGNSTAQGMQVEVMDDAGIGTSEMLWVRYPVPFLTHFYELNAELDPNHQVVIPQHAAEPCPTSASWCDSEWRSREDAAEIIT